MNERVGTPTKDEIQAVLGVSRREELEFQVNGSVLIMKTIMKQYSSAFSTAGGQGSRWLNISLFVLLGEHVL